MWSFLTSRPAISGAVVTLIGLVLRTSQEIGRLFSERILVTQLEGSIRIATCRGALNEAIYARIRQDVIEKLGPKRAELILALDECPRRGGGMSRGEADDAR